MRGKSLSIGLRAALAIFAVTLLATRAWADTHEKVLFNFNRTDGAYTFAGLIFDAAGNLYGTTCEGGAYENGTAFGLTPTAGGGWMEQVLFSFGHGYGACPVAGLIFDAAGNLYGTATGGGNYGLGTVHELTPTAGGGWTEQVLHSFNGGDGNAPWAGVVFGAAGSLYGTTMYGGAYNSGTAFEVTPTADGRWTEKVLYSFNNNDTDGYQPEAGLIVDTAGNLYGTTDYGGAYGAGTVFELTPTAGGGWTENVLHSFGNGTDGSQPFASLIFDAAGNLYGTTFLGGTYGVGTVFELTPAADGDWTENVLYSFGSQGSDGTKPNAGVIVDVVGNLYGTTLSGGTNGDGIVFEVQRAYPCARCPQ